MSSQSGQKNIRNVRTFSEDAEKAREQYSTSKVETDTKVIPPASEATISEKIAEKPESSKQQNIQPPQTNKFLQKKDQPPQPKARVFIPKKRVDLSTEVASIAKPDKTSILIDTEDVFLSGGDSSGSIIRDTKRKRFRLIPSIIEACSVWFKKQRDAYETFRHPNHPITKAEAREQILKAAVRQDAQAPKTDFKDVAERLKSADRTPISSTLSFKEKSEVQAPTWTHVHEEDELPVIENTPPVEELEDTVQEIGQQEELAEMPVQEEAPVPPTEVVTVDPVILYLPQEESIDQNYIQAPEELPMSEAVKRMHETPALSPQTERAQDTQSYAKTQYPIEQKTPILYFIIVILAASVLGIGLSYYFFVIKSTPTEQIIIEYKIPQLLSTSEQKPFRFGEDRRASLEVIKDFVDQSQTVTQLYPTVLDGGIEKPAPVQIIINELQLQAPGSFTRSISEFTFGGTSQRQPFVILKITSFDTAFAGILQWERTMSADLSPLFGNVVINSFDPSARTDTQVREAFFKDVIASNKNVRLLLDEEGKDRIVYTFTNQNTILITTTREALDEILPLVR